TVPLELLEDRRLLSTSLVLSVPQTSFNVVKTTPLSVTVTATASSAGQTLIFSLSANAPTGAGISSQQVPVKNASQATGVLTWTPTVDQGPKSFPFSIIVTDTTSKQPLSASQAITVNTAAAGLVGNNLLIVGTSLNQSTPANPGNDAVSIQATTAPNV